MRPYLLFMLVLAVSSSRADEPELGLTDLNAYRAALKTPAPGPATPVTFRDLWDHPERFEGRRVRVEGKLVRRFGQEAVGQFPALVEAWAISPAGDPFCLVYPSSESAPKLGDAIRFEGTFLRKIRYRGSDTARLAPLVVGDRGPVVTKRGESSASRPFSGDRLWLDGTAALVVAMMVAMVLVRQHLRKPTTVPREFEPAPEFLEPSPSYNEEDRFDQSGRGLGTQP